jgi:hypothetical protein
MQRAASIRFIDQGTARQASVPGLVLRRKCACGGSKSGEAECEECKKKLQRRSAGPAAPSIAPPIVHEVLRSPGQPLDHETRSYFEPRFGHDFSKVRVHSDEKAAQSARDVHALAYTVGNSVVLGKPQISPRTGSGRRLMAHELAHVVQQSAAGTVSNPLEIGAADHPAEYAADIAALRVCEQREPGGVSAIARDPDAQLRRQPPGDDEPEKEPPPLIPLPHPFDRLDIKPSLPLPGGLSLPSSEDLNKGWDKIFGPGDKPKDPTCGPERVKMVDGRCCAGKPGLVDLTNCCFPSQLTLLGTCCPEGVDDSRMNCVSRPPVKPEPPKKPEEKARLSVTLPPVAPLALDLPIHFKQNQPAAAVADETKLRNSLIPEGQGELDNVIAWLQRGGEFSTQLTGMASVEGPTKHNEQLGENRARSVANVLMLRGIGISRISDPPGSTDNCPAVSIGIHNCGDTHASPQVDPNDRLVRARMFIRQKPTVVSTKGQ